MKHFTAFFGVLFVSFLGFAWERTLIVGAINSDFNNENPAKKGLSAVSWSENGG